MASFSKYSSPKSSRNPPCYREKKASTWQRAIGHPSTHCINLSSIRIFLQECCHLFCLVCRYLRLHSRIRQRLRKNFLNEFPITILARSNEIAIGILGQLRPQLLVFKLTDYIFKIGEVFFQGKESTRAQPPQNQ